jgi:hypothetical protein
MHTSRPSLSSEALLVGICMQYKRITCTDLLIMVVDRYVKVIQHAYFHYVLSYSSFHLHPLCMFILAYVQMFVQEGVVMRKSASYWNEVYIYS